MEKTSKRQSFPDGQQGKKDAGPLSTFTKRFACQFRGLDMWPLLKVEKNGDLPGN